MGWRWYSAMDWRWIPVLGWRSPMAIRWSLHWWSMHSTLQAEWESG